MNLNSLPPEMIDQVLKHVRPANIVQLRKINSRIDKIAKTTGRTYLPVEFCRITFGDNYNVSIKLCVDETLAKFYGLRQIIFDRRLLTLDQIHRVLAKLKIVICTLVNFNFSRHIKQLENGKAALRCTKELCLNNALFRQDSNKAKEFIKIFPKCLILRLDGIIEATILSEQMLGGRHWTMVQAVNMFKTLSYSHLDDSYLQSIVPNCGSFILPNYATTNFTLNGLLAVLQHLSERKQYKCEWLLGTIFVAQEEIEELLKNISQVANSEWKKELVNSQANDCFNRPITFSPNPNCRVQVILKKRNSQ